jgi:hypothetical protein
LARQRGDLTEFATQCHPDGPKKIIDGIDDLGMKVGLWFSVREGGWSDGETPAVQDNSIPQPGRSGETPTQPPTGNYRNGFPVNFSNGRPLCIAPIHTSAYSKVPPNGKFAPINCA